MNQNEQWKWIDGFNGYYKISDHGRLMSFHSNPDGKIRKITNKTGGYLTTSLHKKDVRMTVRIHRLVAEAFIGEIPVGYEVHHKDGNKQNNIVSNLEIVTTEEHRAKTMAQIPDWYDGMNRYNKYERPKRIRQYTQDGHFIAEYASGVIAEYYTNVCRRNILQVANHTEYKPGRIRSQAGGFVWVFADEER